MAKYKFSTAQRVALWTAYDKRCAISGEPISFDQLHIDHILPEKLLNDFQELENLKKNYGLEKSFNINNYSNWLPIKARINLQKSDLIYNESSTRYYLSLAERNKNKVLKAEEEFIKQNKKDKILVHLYAAIEKEIIPANEVFQYLQGLNKDGYFQLIEELNFYEKTVSGYINPSDSGNLVELPIDFGSSFEEGLELTNDINEIICVKTCQEFFQAKKQGFYALNTYTMKMESFFNKTCGILQSLSQARLPQRSYIKEPRIGITDLKFLPISMLSSLSLEDDEEKRIAIANGKSIQNWVDEGLIKIKAVTQYSIHIEHGMGQFFSELLRADLNEDGVEDLLVYSYKYAIGGSFGYGEVLTLTRHSTDENLLTLV